MLHLAIAYHHNINFVLCTCTGSYVLNCAFCYAFLVCGYHLYTHTQCIHIQPLQDRCLAIGVLVLVLVDVIILLVYTIVEGVQGNLTAIRVGNREYLMNVEGVG